MKREEIVSTPREPTLAPAKPHTPCCDPERHRLLLRWMWEYQDNVCPYCDPEHANARGELVWDWLCTEQQQALLTIWKEDGRVDLIEIYSTP